jgi:hypothetical protein
MIQWVWVGVSAVSMGSALLTCWVALRIRVEILELKNWLLEAMEKKYALRQVVDERHEAYQERLGALEHAR